MPDIVKKHDSGGLVWKRIKLITTKKANAKKRLLNYYWYFFDPQLWGFFVENNNAIAVKCAFQMNFVLHSFGKAHRHFIL